MSDCIAVFLSRARVVVPENEKFEREILTGLGQLPDVRVTIVPHLYDLSKDGAAMQAIRSVNGDMIVLGWLYPRATYWVLNANGVRARLGSTSSLPEEDLEEPAQQSDGLDQTAWCFDLRTHDKAENYLREIADIVSSTLTPAASTNARQGNGGIRPLEEATRPRWYPVVDFARCINCLECLNFCLFGVFGLDETDSILIEQPDACRAGCPACSRICPQGAIMFPQHNDPAIAGDAKASLENLKLDLSQLFGNSSPLELAARERDRALAEQESQPEKATDETGQPDELDHLVDELDDLDL